MVKVSNRLVPKTDTNYLSTQLQDRFLHLGKYFQLGQPEIILHSKS